MGTCLSSNAAVFVNRNRSDVFPTRPSPSSTILNATEELPLVLVPAFPVCVGCNCSGAERSIADKDANVGGVDAILLLPFSPVLLLLLSSEAQERKTGSKSIKTSMG